MSDGLLMEVDDDLRKQQISAFWKKYGQWISGFAVAALIAVSAGTFYINYMDNKLTEQTANMLVLLEKPSDDTTIPSELADLAKTSPTPLKAVIQLQQAERLEQDKKLDEARNAYESVAAERRAPVILKQLATLHAVRLGLVTKQDTKKLLTMINPLTGDKSGFRGSALELQGMLYLQLGEKEKANTLFTKLSTDSTIPATLRQRALTFITYEKQ